MSKAAGARKIRRGRVVSDSMDKTIVVEISRVKQHPLYGKRLRRQSKVKVHDADEQAQVGDFVQIVETRPMSRTKRWILDDIVEAQEVAAIEIEEAETTVEEAEPEVVEEEVEATEEAVEVQQDDEEEESEEETS